MMRPLLFGVLVIGLLAACALDDPMGVRGRKIDRVSMVPGHGAPDVVIPPPSSPAIARSRARMAARFLGGLWAIVLLYLLASRRVATRLWSIVSSCPGGGWIRLTLFFGILLVLEVVLVVPGLAVSRWVAATSCGSLTFTSDLVAQRMLEVLIGAAVSLGIAGAQSLMILCFSQRWWWLAWLGSAPFLIPGFWAYVYLCHAELVPSLEPVSHDSSADSTQIIRRFLHRCHLEDVTVRIGNVPTPAGLPGGVAWDLPRHREIWIWWDHRSPPPLEDVEVTAAHEAGHLLFLHARKIGFILLLLSLVGHALIDRVRSWNSRDGPSGEHHPLSRIPQLQLAALLTVLILSPVQLNLQRSMEAEAESFGLLATGHLEAGARSMAQGMRKIDGVPGSDPVSRLWTMSHPSWEESILFCTTRGPEE